MLNSGADYWSQETILQRLEAQKGSITKRMEEVQKRKAERKEAEARDIGPGKSNIQLALG
jgi:hypothetical protein